MLSLLQWEISLFLEGAIEMTQFIKVGEDRIKLDTIERYGIKFGVRYLVKDADEIGVEVDGRVFDSAYTDYGASWREEEDIKTAAPIHDMNTGLPVKINREVVGYGCIPPSGFVVKKDRILYVDDSEYFASVVDFDIDEKVAELDRYFLGEEVSPSDVSPSQT